MLQGFHKGSVTYCYGDWRLNKHPFEIELSQLTPLLTEDRLKTLSLTDIAWKGKHLPDKFRGENCICCGGVRYREADIQYPCIVVEDMPNMYKNKYRLIDGKHRIEKLSSKADCYVLTWENICDIITWTSITYGTY